MRMQDMNTIDGFDDALRQCGVTTDALGKVDRAELDSSGYIVVRDLVDHGWLEELRKAFDDVMPTALTDGGRQTGTRHAEDLVRRNRAFARVAMEPKVLAAAHHVLKRPFQVLQLSGRDPLHGYGQQGLHQDWMPRRGADPFSVVTAIWLLDNFTESNGATRLVPGSHLDPRLLPKSMRAPGARHRDEMSVLASAGDVLIFNGHLWHSGTSNRTHRSRRVLQCQFVAKESARSFATSTDPPDGLTPLERYLFGA